MKNAAYVKDNQTVLNLLKNIEKFSFFSDDDLLSFLDLGKLIKYEDGETIIKEGDYDQSIYFLISGKVEIIKAGKIIDILRRSGDLFGEMGVVDDSPRCATIQAMTKTLVLSVDASLMQAKPQRKHLAFSYTIFRLFAEVLAERLRYTTQENVKLKKELDEKNSLIEEYQGG
ncbi:MAG: cyclic nucleotide-binding domain-containing protein [Desulfobulbaceae bacterium]|nr:cyclic nucleotide-binding domain-containing protein [Desulfobulbaceae bacterium]MCK5323275.1 cyclic nucleotide-binding domain-containing protein [Desulfobulbaceae bacterium]MCK5437274.1 cyclic nucleotide-binding domain-containing protein [Desulfobulbaceae bacterium]MCK5544640.1 cyclic nucleotide-binding domain-containing protein [Desulfobulbaceae bacterium]